MGNALNVRVLNNINTIAQGDTASTIQIELLDEHKLAMPEFDGVAALVNFVDGRGEIVYQVNTVVFDSRVEFNIGAVLQFGKYTIEIVIAREGYTYVFPSNGKTELNINRSSSHYYTIALESIGPEAIVTDVFNRIKGEFPGALEHSAKKDNPHEVTAEQVGLGRVPNYSMSTQALAEGGSHTNYLMSPLRTKQAIDAQIPIEDREKWDNSASVQYVDDSISNINIPDHAPYDNHLSSTDNPHNVTKSQVGLGNVPNLPLASQADAEGGVVSGSFMTPLRTKQAIDTLVPISEFNSHMEDSGVHVSPEDRSSWDSKATQTDIDNTLGSINIPNKADFDQAMDGTNDSAYMTPFRVHQKVVDATNSVVQIVDNVVEFINPLITNQMGSMSSYKSIPGFAARVTIAVQAEGDLPDGGDLFKVSGGNVFYSTMTATIRKTEGEEKEVSIGARSSSSGTTFSTKEPLQAGDFVMVVGLF